MPGIWLPTKHLFAVIIGENFIMHSSLVIPYVLQLIMTINACSLKGYSNEYVQTSKIAYFFIQKMGTIFLWEMLQVMHLSLQLVVNLTKVFFHKVKCPGWGWWVGVCSCIRLFR